MRTAIVIPVWNGIAWLGECLASVMALQDGAHEVIAVDNGSQDGSPEFIRRHFPQVRLIRNDYNLGFGAACNQGIAAASGDLIVLLNQDTRLAPNWLTEIQTAFDSPEVGIAGCKILYHDSQILQHAGAWVEWPLGIVHHYGVGEEDRGQWDEARSVEIVTFAAVAIRRRVFERVGAFDLDFGLGYYEDVDLCLRARGAGFDVVYVPRAVVHHGESSSLKHSELIHFQYQQGRLRLLLKHLSPQRFLEEFVPAEIESQKLAVRNQDDCSALRWAYLAAMTTAGQLHAGKAEPGQLAALHDALHRLYQTAWAESRTYSWEQPMVRAGSAIGTSLGDIPVITDLSLHEFPSGLPVIGPMVSLFRRTWYNMAAKWGDLRLLGYLERIVKAQAHLGAWLADLSGGQQELNRVLEVEMGRLAGQVDGLIAENGRLARQMARLQHPYGDALPDGSRAREQGLQGESNHE